MPCLFARSFVASLFACSFVSLFVQVFVRLRVCLLVPCLLFPVVVYVFARWLVCVLSLGPRCTCNVHTNRKSKNASEHWVILLALRARSRANAQAVSQQSLGSVGRFRLVSRNRPSENMSP